MRLRIQLLRQGEADALPINYQYELSSWIYRVLDLGNSSFAAWLHDQGFQFLEKRFRLFCFSQLDLRPYQRRGDRLIMRERAAFFELGFTLPASGYHFLQGLFADQAFSLGDRHSQVAFRVGSVQLLPEPRFDEPSQVFRAMSPICVSRPRETGQPAQYLHPEEPDYAERLYYNLMNKRQSYLIAQGALSAPYQPYWPELFQLKLLSAPRSQLVTIAAHTKQETQVRGYRFDFQLRCDPGWLSFLWNAGLGEKNSQGFGCISLR